MQKGSLQRTQAAPQNAQAVSESATQARPPALTRQHAADVLTGGPAVCSGSTAWCKRPGPFYDRAICAMVKETVEPIMEQYKPPGLVKAMYFKTPHLWDAPLQIDNVWIEQEGENHLLLEVS